MYNNVEEALTVIRTAFQKGNFLENRAFILGVAPQYLPYYDSSRKYTLGEVFQVNKPADSGFGSEKVKYLVIQEFPSTEVRLDESSFVRPFQDYKEVPHWFLNEYISKGLRRISIEDGQIYESTKFIEMANKDPALTTDGKWVLVPQEEV